MGWLETLLTVVNLIMILGNIAMIRLAYELLMEVNEYHKRIVESKYTLKD